MSYHEKFTKGALVLAAAALAVAVACSDRVTAPTPRDRSATSDFVASGVMYNVLRVPTSSGLRVARSSFVPLELTSTKGVARASVGEITPANSDSRTAALDGDESPAFLLPGLGPDKSVPRLVLKGRRLSQHTVDGKRITLAIAPDDDKRSKRPPKAMLVLANDRIAAITEYKYARRGGAWKATRSRTTFLSESGTVTLVMDNDLSGLIYRPGQQSSNSVGWLRNTAARLRADFLSVVQPDALWAAIPSLEEEQCWREVQAATAANAAFVAAGIGVAVAQNAEQAAIAALAAATAACIAEPSTCSVVDIAAGALTAAELGVTKAWALLVAASAAVAAADAALSACMYPPDPPQTEQGPSGSEGEAGCEEWCQWTITFTGDRMNVRRDFCWCENGDDAV